MNILDVKELKLIIGLVHRKLCIVQDNLRYMNEESDLNDSEVVVECLQKEVNELLRTKCHLESMLEHEENIKEDI